MSRQRSRVGFALFSVLSNRVYRHLFAAQVIALLGTGLATVALALLAYDLAGNDAGQVLGTALAIKMIGYVGVSPVAAAVTARLPRRKTLVALDLVRMAVALMLPFVTAIWQVYLLTFVLQSASAAFTPAFQATIPDILPDEEDYTKALSLSRLAYDLESLVSPTIAAALLTVISFHFLFAGTAFGFLASSALVASVSIPAIANPPRGGIYDRTIRGLKIYLATPRLRGLLAINMAVAAAGALVIVNTVVYVQATFGLSERQTAFALGAFGGGSMLIALVLPAVIHQTTERSVMLSGALVLAAGALAASVMTGYVVLLVLWFLIGAGYSLAQLPSGRILRKSAHQEDRPAIFAAQFALSHACWLISYPVAGWFGSASLSMTALVLGVIALLAAGLGAFLWPATDSEVLAHCHPDLPSDHPHLEANRASRGKHHAHAYIIDDLHPAWPHVR